MCRICFSRTYGTRVFWVSKKQQQPHLLHAFSCSLLLSFVFIIYVHKRPWDSASSKNSASHTFHTMLQFGLSVLKRVTISYLLTNVIVGQFIDYPIGEFLPMRRKNDIKGGWAPTQSSIVHQIWSKNADTKGKCNSSLW